MPDYLLQLLFTWHLTVKAYTCKSCNLLAPQLTIIMHHSSSSNELSLLIAWSHIHITCSYSHNIITCFIYQTHITSHNILIVLYMLITAFTYQHAHTITLIWLVISSGLTYTHRWLIISSGLSCSHHIAYTFQLGSSYFQHVNVHYSRSSSFPFTLHWYSHIA